MFVGNLNEPQQQVLIALTKQLIAADGEINEKEKEILAFIESQCSLSSVESSETPINQDKIISIFNDQRSTVSLILELLGVAYSDSHYDEEEKRFVEKVANDLSVPSELMEQLESWVHRQFILTREAEILMEG